jgi:hypothetical protein
MGGGSSPTWHQVDAGTRAEVQGVALGKWMERGPHSFFGEACYS